MLRVGIVGATGYTGRELVRLLLGHKEVEITCLTSESHAGRQFSHVFPEFLRLCDQPLVKFDSKELQDETDFLFSALPHGLSRERVPELLSVSEKVIDLSGDFRLKDGSLYPLWYGYEHHRRDLLAESVYGLPEVNREAIAGARLVANPGCYPTSILLALKPVLQEGLVDPKDIIADAKSGVSGAGRSPKLPFHYPECSENFKAYRVASHQHTPEIEEQAAILAGEETLINFTPHLVPMVRGILSTIYVKLIKPWPEEELFRLYEEHYGREPFIRLHAPPGLPETRYVRDTNFCDLALRLDGRNRRLILVAAIDNLIKGAAGQAVQNMNIMHGWREEEGLL
jgi:N-acetyl-gamma-glutamyl-phosphate reductase